MNGKIHNLPISGIKVGRRHRRDLGDINALARSIKEGGLLHPVAVTPGEKLIAGERRLEDAKTLGWKNIPAHTVDLVEIVRGEFHENIFRKNFLPTEAVAIAKTLESEEKKIREG